MASLKNDLAQNDRATMAWFPGQRQIWRVFDNTTQDKADPLPGGEVGGVGWAFALARWFPFLQGVIPWAMSKYVSWFPEQGVYRSDQVDFRVPHLNTHALSTFVPVEQLPHALAAIRRVFEQHHYTPHMPVAIRFVAGDPSADLSPTRGKPCAVIEVFAEANFPKETWEATFKDVELALTSLGGHPHWAKGFIENPRPLYPKAAWDNYERLRHRMDPDGKFVNDWARGFLPPPAKPPF
jgi:FAD/FMN-containing dehydrogenase